MTLGKFNLWAFIFTMIMLYIGGFFAAIIIPMIPISGMNGWVEGILTGVIQAIFLAVFGLLAGKLDLWNLLTSGVVIFIGSILGGIIAGFVDTSGFYATIIILAVQTAILSFTGLSAKGRSSKL